MKSVLITGATSGIGKALALKAADRGYQVTACGRNTDALEALSKQANIQTLQFDVTDIENVKQQLDDKTFDISVLNAGTCEYVDLPAFEPALFKRVFEVNFFGIVNCLHALLPSCKRGSQIVIIDSMARLLPFTRSQAYGASKAAVHYMAQSLSVDLAGKGVKIQSVSPGFVETPLTDKNDFEMPMKITADEAASMLLRRIESKQSAIYFPVTFGVMLRILGHLPQRVKRWLSIKLKQAQ